MSSEEIAIDAGTLEHNPTARVWVLWGKDRKWLGKITLDGITTLDGVPVTQWSATRKGATNDYEDAEIIGDIALVTKWILGEIDA